MSHIAVLVLLNIRIFAGRDDSRAVRAATSEQRWQLNAES
jgi:hypothetical protein